MLGSIKEIPVDIKFNPGSCDEENDILEEVKIKNVQILKIKTAYFHFEKDFLQKCS